MPSLSVVIPTHCRAGILSQCLDCLARQTVAGDIEVIVVSDGHDADTVALITKAHTSALPFPLRFFEQEKSQQGAARNLGVKHATGRYVFFIGDDAFLKPHACERHLVHLARQPQCVLGFTTWDPALTITPVMRWLEKSGWQFAYPMLRDYEYAQIPPSMQSRFTYAIHISMPTDIAQKHPFREGIALYGWEDIEWGASLAQAGIPLFYAPDAVALHHHVLTLDASLARMKTLGQSAVQMEAENPSLSLTPKGMKKFAYRLSSLLPTMAGMHRRAFLEGIDRHKPFTYTMQ